MSVSDELLCSFELLKPLDSSALKSHIKKGRNKRNSILNSPVCRTRTFPYVPETDLTLASCSIGSKLLTRRFISKTIAAADEFASGIRSLLVQFSPRRSCHRPTCGEEREGVDYVVECRTA